MPGADEALHFWTLRFENDVKTYGTQTNLQGQMDDAEFENDVKTYGTQTLHDTIIPYFMFENDVKTYGTQTADIPAEQVQVFENDVKTYGTQTIYARLYVGNMVWEWCKNVWYSNPVT